MSLSDHSSDELLKLRMTKRPPHGKGLFDRIFFISLWHGSENGAASRPNSHHV